MYKLVYEKQTGRIVTYSKFEITNEDPECVLVTVSDEYQNLFEEFKKGIKYSNQHKVDVESKELKIVSTVKYENTIDPYIGSVVNIRRKIKPDHKLMIQFYSEDHTLRVRIKHQEDKIYIKSLPKNSFNVWLTAKNNVNYLFENFYCNFDNFDDNNEMTFPITRIDPNNIYSGNFSLYYKKIFADAGYEIL